MSVEGEPHQNSPCLHQCPTHSWELEGLAEEQEQEKVLGVPRLQLEVSRSEGGAEDKAEVHCMAMKAKVEEVLGQTASKRVRCCREGRATRPPQPVTWHPVQAP